MIRESGTWRIGMAGATGFLMGLMLSGIAIAVLSLAVMLHWIPSVHLVEGLHIVWIDMANEQLTVTVREGILLPALVYGVGNALMSRPRWARRRAV